MKIRQRLSPLGLSLLLAASTSAIAEEEQTLNLNADGLDTMAIEAGAGRLSVIGVDNANGIRVEAKIDANPDDYTLTLERDGNSAKLVSKIESNIRFIIGRANYIDLDVFVPNHLIMDIDDGSGDVLVENISKAVTIRDGSGSLRIKNIGGDLKLNDGSGSIRIESAKGNISFIDGSGSITISDVGGSIDGNDGSGSFSATDIAGDLELTDGSGSIKIEKVAGDVIVNDGSGSIEITEIDGHVKGHDGAGDIRIASVTNGLTIDGSGSGSVKTDNVQGNVFIDD